MASSSEYVQDAWRPQVPEDLIVCNVFRCSALQSDGAPDRVSPSADASSPVDVARRLMLPGRPRQRLVIVWYATTCPACIFMRTVKDRNGLTLVERLRRAGPTATPPFQVIEVEWQAALHQEEFPHVRMVPVYDIVDPSSNPNDITPYGTATRFESVPNAPGAIEDKLGLPIADRA